MNRRQRDRNAARARHAKRIRPEDLAPSQREGLTIGLGARDALKATPNKYQAHLDGEALIQHQLGGKQQTIGRIPIFRAVLRDDTHTVWKENDGRLQRNVIASVDIETFRAMQAGAMCLRCYEPVAEGESFPDTCDMCGYPMRERQIMDIAMEFRGHEHIGPGMPTSEFLAEMDERAEQRERAAAKREGRSPMSGLRKKILSPGAKRLRGVKDGDVRATQD